MATLISQATGNFTAAGTWKLADATSELDAQNGSTSSTTSFVASTAFTPGAITVDAVAVKVASKTSGGTFTVELFNSTGALSIAQVTVDIADLPSTGWVVFPIGSTLLLAATNYQIRIKTSSSATVNLYRNATGGNWSRQLRTTTTQAPAAGDKLIVAGEHTGSGSGNSFVVTMNETATTIYGNVSFLESISINKRATLQYGTAASTNYYLKVAGFVRSFDQGIFNIGTTGTPVPSTSTAVLEFSNTAAVDSGLITMDGSTFTAQGATVIDRAYLAADAAAAATTVTTDVSTGWLSSDIIAFAPTGRVTTEHEQRTLSANAVGTSVSVTVGLTYAHNGTSAYAHGEVINLTRNVKIRSVSTTLVGYISVAATATVDMDYTELSRLGNAGSSTSGIAVNTTTGSFSIENCSFYDFSIASTAAIRILSATANDVTISNNVFYINYLAVYFSVENTINATIAVNNNWSIAGSLGFLQSVNSSAVITNNRASGCTGTGINLPGTSKLPQASVANNVSHACSTGFIFSGISDGTIEDNTAFRNTSIGIDIGNCVRMLFDDLISFGNTTANIRVQNNLDCLVSDLVANGEAGFASAYGMYVAGYNDNSIISNASFGATVTHTTGDLVNTASLTALIFHNTTFNSPTEYALSINKPGTSYASQRHQSIAGNNKLIKYEGTITRDTVIYNSASPSMRMTPSQSLIKLRSGLFVATAANGSTVTAAFYVRKSVVGDGTAYNGAQPRLLVKANPSAGIPTYTLLATAAAAAGTWELLSGTTAAVTEDTKLEFFIDCDGTTGWINVDDATLPAVSTVGFNVWANGEAYVQGASSGGGESSVTFVG